MEDRDDELKEIWDPIFYWVTLSHWEAKMSLSMRRGPQRDLWDGMHSSPTLSPCEIQTGLAFTPFAFADTRYSVDWAIAWAMIGEWTNHQLFPPPKSGERPRFAHVNGLEEGFRYRRPSLVTWARACFEQGATFPCGAAWGCGGTFHGG